MCNGSPALTTIRCARADGVERDYFQCQGCPAMATRSWKRKHPAGVIFTCDGCEPVEAGYTVQKVNEHTGAILV